MAPGQDYRPANLGWALIAVVLLTSNRAYADEPSGSKEEASPEADAPSVIGPPPPPNGGPSQPERESCLEPRDGCSSQRAPAAEPRARQSDTSGQWYWWQTLIPDVAALSLLVGSEISSPLLHCEFKKCLEWKYNPDWSPGPAFIVGASLYAAGAPSLHFAHGLPSRGFLSIASRLVMPAVSYSLALGLMAVLEAFDEGGGAFLSSGQGSTYGRESPSYETRTIAIYTGSAIGVAAPIMLDAIFLSRTSWTSGWARSAVR
jgi:hypothetical protein